MIATAVSAPASDRPEADDGRAEELLADLHALGSGDPRADAIKTELIHLHGGYVRALVNQYAGRGEPIEDITQSAMVGLIKAINGYDPAIGERFLPYARKMILGEVKRHFRDKTWRIRVPRRVQELRIRLRAANRELTAANARPPRVSELAQYLDVTLDEVVDVINADSAYWPQSLDIPLSADEESATLGDVVGSEDPDLQLMLDKAALRPLLDQLPARERTILLLRFWGNQNQYEIAERMGISQMHVSRLINQTLASLRRHLLSDSAN